LEERVSELNNRIDANWRLRFFILLGAAVLVLAGTIFIMRDTGSPPGGSGSPPNGGSGPPGSDD
jgi:hypothetical protein